MPELDTNRRSGAASSIAYTPVPLIGGPAPLIQLLSILGLFGLGYVVTRIRVASTPAPSACSFILVAMLGVPLVSTWVGAPFLRRLRNLRRAAALQGHRSPEDQVNSELERLVSSLFYLELETSLFRWKRADPWKWQDLMDRLRDGAAELPRTIADQSRAGALRAIPLLDHTLEPEPIASGSHFSRRSAIVYFLALTCFFLGFGVTLLTQPSVEKVVLLVLWLGMCLLTLAKLPAIRQRFPELPFWLGWRQPVIAGMGVVRDSKGRQWNAGRALMILSVTSARSPIRLSLVGPSGWLGLTFGNETDPEFVKVWQRWNHPHPRPELLE